MKEMGAGVFRKRRCRFLLPALAAVLLWPSPSSAQRAYITGLERYPLRSTPQFSAEATARIPTGAQVQVLERQAGWVRVRSGENTGWMPESVVGSEIPATVQLGPIRERMSSLEEDLERVLKENTDLREENRVLTEKSGALEEGLAEARRAERSARSYQKFWGVALGGGLVIFGWLAGYALANISRKRGAKQKYKI